MTQPQQPPPPQASYAATLAALIAAQQVAGGEEDQSVGVTALMSEAIIQVRERAAEWAKRQIRGLWSRSDPYNPESVREFTLQAARVMRTAQTSTARAAAAGQTQQVRAMGLQVRTAPSNPPDVRAADVQFDGGAAQLVHRETTVNYADAERLVTDSSTETVLERIPRTFRYEESVDGDAAEAALARLDSLVDDNLMLAQRIAETEVLAAVEENYPTPAVDDDIVDLDEEPDEPADDDGLDDDVFTDLAEDEPVDLDTEDTEYVIGKRRVIHPELSRGGVCGMCVIAADRVYKVKALLPIHANCKCTTALITNKQDPGKQLNRQELNQIYKEAGGNFSRRLKRVRYQIQEHGELGPVFVAENKQARDLLKLTKAEAEEALREEQAREAVREQRREARRERERQFRRQRTST